MRQSPLIRDYRIRRPAFHRRHVAATLATALFAELRERRLHGVAARISGHPGVVVHHSIFRSANYSDEARVFLFDASMIPGTAISATHIRLDLRGNGDVP
jgi:hypothetical protein